MLAVGSASVTVRGKKNAMIEAKVTGALTAGCRHWFRPERGRAAWSGFFTGAGQIDNADGDCFARGARIDRLELPLRAAVVPTLE